MLTPLKRAASRSRPSAGHDLVSLTILGLTSARTFRSSGRVAGKIAVSDGSDFDRRRSLSGRSGRGLRAGVPLLTKNRSCRIRCTTALPPKADVHPGSCYVAFVPKPAVVPFRVLAKVI